MEVINELTRKIESSRYLVRGIVYKDDKYIEFGYFPKSDRIPLTFYDGIFYYDISNINIKMERIFSLIHGTYQSFLSEDPRIEEHKNVFGNGNFPYTINREYEARHHIEMFEEDDRLNHSEEATYNFSKCLKYSFGIEFETAAGYLPEDKCFELGLIPLRDGSISGIEYSTIPMSGNEGVNLLKKQLEALKKYTYTNKECSIHMHLGGYPVDPKAIFILHNFWYFVQNRILKYIPAFSYNTECFKKNEKNYCGRINYFEDFKQLYRFYVGQSYLGNLYQPHPNDIYKQAKWNIKTRYFNCNFINMLCYNSAKTVEFRFLTPTYSFEKIITFLLIFNAVLYYSEELYKKIKNKSYSEIGDILCNMERDNYTSVKEILKKVYSNEVFDLLNNNLKKLDWLITTQRNVGDNNGGRLDIENRYFPDGKQEN